MIFNLLAQVPTTWPAYRPFLHPMPIWDHWMWLLLPLAAGVSIIYKSIKCRDMRQVPLQAAVIFFWIIAGMAVAAAILWILVRWRELTV